MTAQELKNSILQLAVQGKLVPQDKNDEPASELLKRIQAEKVRLIKEGKIKKEKALPPIAEEELPFDIPESWVWIHFEHVGFFQSGYTPKPSQLSSNGLIPYFKISDMNKKGNEKFLIHTENFLYSSNERNYPKGSIVYPKNGGAVYTNKRRILSCDSVVDLNTGIFSLYDTTILPYLFMVFNNLDFKKYSIASPLPTLDMNAIKRIMVPLPPLAEQQRIVEKIEELLPLVEEYGKAETRLKELNADFPEMLRKSILQQAVQGKLTERNPEDEPASELLKRIQAEKAQLIKDGKIKKEKPLPPITEDEIPFDIPDGWEYCRLKDICYKIVDGDHNPPKAETYQTAYLMLSSQNINYDRICNLENVRYLSKEIFAIENERTMLTEGDILFTSVGTLGRSCVYYGGLNACFQRSVSVISTFIYNKYLKYFFDAPHFQNMVLREATGTAQKGFYLNQLSKAVIAIPPLEEQKRIVARVEELLALCNSLNKKNK